MTDEHETATNTAPEVRPVPPLMTATWETALGDPDPLIALGATRALAPLLSTWEARLVGEATAAGATWETIGATVGVSRQAAWERFHHEADEFRRRWKSEFHDLRKRHRQEMEELRDQLRGEARSRGGGRGRGRGHGHDHERDH
jgi:hypothetical protein